MMIPNGMRRGAQSRGGLPLPLIVATATAALVGWTLLSMGSEPTAEPVTADVPVAL